MAKKKAVAKKAAKTPVGKLGAEEKAKLRKLLQAKESAASIAGCRMLESLEATATDFAEIFTPTVLCQLVNSWDVDVCNSVTDGLKCQPTLKRAFEDLATKRFATLSPR